MAEPKRWIPDARLNRGIWSLRCTRGNCPDAEAKPCWLHGRYRRGRAPGMDVVGYLRSEIGLGEAARLLFRAAEAADVPAGLVDVPLPHARSEAALAGRIAASGRHATAVSVAGALELRTFARRACRGQRNIAYPYWELPMLTPILIRALDGFDALWAPSTFIRDTLAASQPRPVHLVPQPVDLPEAPPPPRPLEGPLRVLTFFDYDSVVARKNPAAAVRAFCTAFPTGREDAQLIVKARGRDATDAGRELAGLARSDPRISLVDRLLTRDEMTALMASCDLFVSLHRSEGFGLGCAEALAQGLGVVATDFSGTRDIVTDATGFPVAWRKVPVGPGAYPAGDGAYWAEPDVEHAAAILRAVYDDPGEAAARADEGFRALGRSHGLAVVGRRIRDALEA